MFRSSGSASKRNRLDSRRRIRTSGGGRACHPDKDLKRAAALEEQCDVSSEKRTRGRRVGSGRAHRTKRGAACNVSQRKPALVREASRAREREGQSDRKCARRAEKSRFSSSCGGRASPANTLASPFVNFRSSEVSAAQPPRHFFCLPPLSLTPSRPAPQPASARARKLPQLTGARAEQTDHSLIPFARARAYKERSPPPYPFAWRSGAALDCFSATAAGVVDGGVVVSALGATVTG